MKIIFEQGALGSYSQVSLNESRSSVLQYSRDGARKTTVLGLINTMT